MTQLEYAKKRIVTDDMAFVARREGVSPVTLRRDVRRGRTVILKRAGSPRAPVGVGRGLSVKINANLGTSPLRADQNLELEKLAAAVKYGADAVMDLSTGGDIAGMRRKVLVASAVPVGTVPVYEAVTRRREATAVTADDILDSIRTHIEDGVDFVTMHCGVRRAHIPLLESRIMGVVSRGGSFLVKWMLAHGRENPLYERFDEVLELARARDVVLSLGDGLRPGCLHDATDRAQLAELKTLGELARRARAAGVQVMIEGPGHVPLHQVEENIRLEKKLCRGAPFYVLGPLVTDVSPGYDHIAGAIGGALAARAGADFLCYLTPKEHLGLPNLEDVVEGVIASKIAAHAADLARGQPGRGRTDDEMAEARSRLDWEKMLSLALNPDKARAMRGESLPEDEDICSMCGEFCSAKANRDICEKVKMSAVRRRVGA
ncbi:MAG: phosphomethylpyrimidine synthase ThiC [Spirochaetales bacterium]|nr:phosphomethylpyrimidine synthase ThiC [Spirochaetales bacterium]